MKTPESVTVGVVLYSPEVLGADDLARESAHAARLAARLGVDEAKAFGQAAARRVPRGDWDRIVAALKLEGPVGLLASVHFFQGRPDPAEVAGALAVFAHVWLHRREHGTEPPGGLALADMPPGPLADARTLREAAPAVNGWMLDDARYGEWMRAFERAWDEEPAPN